MSKIFIKPRSIKLYYATVMLLVFYPSVTKSATEFDNPLKFNTIQEFVGGFLQAVVYIGFPIAVLFVVYSGFLFVFAQGNSEQLGKAKRNFLWTIVGVALLLGASALAALIKGTIDQLR